MLEVVRLGSLYINGRSQKVGNRYNGAQIAFGPAIPGKEIQWIKANGLLIADRCLSVSFCILQIGELVVGLIQEYRDSTKDRIEWRQIREIRNIVVHDYGNVNLKIVWGVARRDIPALKEFCNEQLSKADL